MFFFLRFPMFGFKKKGRRDRALSLSLEDIRSRGPRDRIRARNQCIIIPRFQGNLFRENKFVRHGVSRRIFTTTTET